MAKSPAPGPPVGTIPATTSDNIAAAINQAVAGGVRPKKKNKKNKNKNKAKGNNVPLLKDVTTTVESLFGDSNKVMWISIAAAIVFSHNNNMSEGFLGTYLSSADNTLAKWALENSQKAMGLICFLPLVMTLPEDKRFKMILACVVGVLSAPPLKLSMYVMLSLASYVALHVKSKTNRMYILAGCAFIAYRRIDMLSWLFPQTTTLPNPPPLSTVSSQHEPVAHAPVTQRSLKEKREVLDVDS